MQSQDQAGPGQAASWASAPAVPTVDSKPAARLTNGVWRVAGQLPEATRPSLGGRAARNLRRNRPSTAGPGPARPNSGAGPALCGLQSLLASRHSGHSPRGKPRVAAASSGRAGISRATPPYPHGRGGRTAGPTARSRLVPRLEPAAWRLRVTPSQRARDGTVTEHGPGFRERESFRECSMSHTSRSFLQKQSSDQTALNSRAAISKTPAHRTHREEKAGSRVPTRTGGRETAHASLMGSAAGCSPRRTPSTDTRRNLPP